MSNMRAKNVNNFIRKKLDRKEVVHIEKTKASKGEYLPLRHELDKRLLTALKKNGVDKFYNHQAEAIDAILDGNNVVIATSTSSGKSLCYLVPVFQKCLEKPETTAMMIFPTKALSQDQLRTIENLKSHLSDVNINAGTYDGDTPTSLRRTLRFMSNIILTNPDMLHQGILPNHFRWTHFLSNLRYVVIDEIHTYRGIFGSNVSNVMRRLQRICRSYGSNPVFISCSATINNPKELADGITGRQNILINTDGSPHGQKQFILFNPRTIDDEGLARVSPISEARRLMADLIRERIQTISFSRTRRSAEIIFRYCLEDLQKEGPSLANAVKAYRGGYLPEERREIERGLVSGEILGVSSTNALELGIDIGGLDASLIVGYPGSIASLWQQAGRAGRGLEPSLAVLIAQNSPIDQFLMRNPEYLFEQSPENAVIDPDNPELAIWHLICALYELPVNEDEMNLFGKYTTAMLEMLLKEGRVRTSQGRWNLMREADDYPAAKVNLRCMNNVIYTIIEKGDEERVIGTVDESTAFTQVHNNAVYLHDAETYIVTRLDIERKIAWVQKEGLDYYTQAVSESNIRIDNEESRKNWLSNIICLGYTTVTDIVTMFKKVKFHTSESLGYENLTLPAQRLETTSFWCIPHLDALQKAREFGRLPEEGLLGITNVLVNVMSLYTMCDINDIGAVIDSSNLGRYAIFVYDRYHGGIGFAARGYTMIKEVLEGTLKVIQDCECQDGCPSCVGALAQASLSPIDAATRDQIPDKHAALVVLHEMLDLPDYIPPSPDSKVKSTIPKPGTFERMPRGMERRIHNRLRKDEAE